MVAVLQPAGEALQMLDLGAAASSAAIAPQLEWPQTVIVRMSRTLVAYSTVAATESSGVRVPCRGRGRRRCG